MIRKPLDHQRPSQVLRPPDLMPRSVHTEASIGVAIGPSHGSDADTLRRADGAIYSAKKRRIGTAVAVS